MLELKKVRKSALFRSVPLFTGIPLDNGKKWNGTERNQIKILNFILGTGVLNS